jgi:hypothetical protein
MWKLGIYSICFCRCCRKGLHFNCLDFPDPELIRELSKDRILAIDWGVFVGGEQISGLPRVNDFRARSPRFTLEAMEANQAVVEAVEQLATAKGATAAQVALAWLLARGPRIVPIFGTRRLDRVKENLGAAEVRLSDEDMAAIEACLARIEVTGERLPPAIRLLSACYPLTVLPLITAPGVTRRMQLAPPSSHRRWADEDWAGFAACSCDVPRIATSPSFARGPTAHSGSLISCARIAVGPTNPESQTLDNRPQQLSPRWRPRPRGPTRRAGPKGWSS